MCMCVSVCHLLLQDAVKYEDEHSLQRVKDGKEVGHDDCTLIDIHQSKCPGQPQQTQQSYGTYNPGPKRERVSER